MIYSPTWKNPLINFSRSFKELVYTVFKGLVSLCLSQETKILTKAIFCFQLLNHLFDGVFQIFDIAHILTSLPAPALPGRYSCTVPLRLIRRGAAKQLVDGTAQHFGQLRKDRTGRIPLTRLPLGHRILLSPNSTGKLCLGKTPFLSKCPDLKTGPQSWLPPFILNLWYILFSIWEKVNMAICTNISFRENLLTVHILWYIF